MSEIRSRSDVVNDDTRDHAARFLSLRSSQKTTTSHTIAGHLKPPHATTRHHSPPDATARQLEESRAVHIVFGDVEAGKQSTHLAHADFTSTTARRTK
jgi:hypothetical protein